MSDLIVRVVNIDEVIPHPNADKLEIVKVGGWQIISGKGNWKPGDTAIHIPPECMVPKELSDKWEVSDYLSWKKDATKGRVKAIKLRSIPSYGFLAPVDAGMEVGQNVAELLGIEKYEEPVRIHTDVKSGQQAVQHPFFHKYTDIQNLRNFPDKLDYTQKLVITEKIHGTNSRIGFLRCEGADELETYEWAVGTHRTQRKIDQAGDYILPLELYGAQFDALVCLFEESAKLLNETIDSIIFHGEIFGPGVQDLHYGLTNKSWLLFDISINGEYTPWYILEQISAIYGIPLVPYTFLEENSSFQELCDIADMGKSAFTNFEHIKEGIVVRPYNDELFWKEGEFNPNSHRMIFKLLSSDYLTRKGGSEKH